LRRDSWKKRGIDFGGDTGFIAEVGEVGGEAVADVECGGGERAALQVEALGDARLGIEMRANCAARLFGIAADLSCWVARRVRPGGEACGCAT